MTIFLGSMFAVVWCRRVRAWLCVGVSASPAITPIGLVAKATRGDGSSSSSSSAATAAAAAAFEALLRAAIRETNNISNQCAQQP
jgi:hypothetical protein